MNRPRLGLRARATVLGAVVFSVLLVGGSVLLVSALEDRLVAASDQLSRSRVEDLLALARSDGLTGQLRQVDDNGVAQVVAADGTVLAASPNIEGQPAVAPPGNSPRLETRTFRAPDDQEVETYRFWYAVGTSPDGSVTAYVGNSLESVTEATATVRWELTLGVPVTVALLTLAVWLLLGRVIGRLDRIRAEVDRISEESLDTRVEGDGVDDEVGRLAATMNAMLARLDLASRRQREFVADVSHDLQSPLAAQRVALEVALAGTEVDRAQLREDVLGATADMERLVGDLLMVAALDAGVRSEPVSIDLDDVVLEEATRARAGHTVELDTSRVSAAPAYADREDVRRVVRNLLDNAVRHAATRVVLRAAAVGDAGPEWTELLVTDDGPGIAPEHRKQVFERFYRVAADRSRDGGSGLGLPIARELAERNGGTVELLEGDGHGGTTMRLRLPMSAQRPPPPTAQQGAVSA